jgi:hypothetical protein
MNLPWYTKHDVLLRAADRIRACPPAAADVDDMIDQLVRVLMTLQVVDRLEAI